MPALTWDFARQIDAAASPGNTTSYYDGRCQAFYTLGTYIMTQIGLLDEGQWQDVEYGDPVVISNIGYGNLDIEHHFNDIVFGTAYTNGNVVLLLYDYRASPTELYTNGEIKLQPGNSIKNASIDLTRIAQIRAEDSSYGLFKPGSVLSLKYHLNKEPSCLIGMFVIQSLIQNELKRTITINAQNKLGNKLTSQTFDDNGVFVGTVSKVIEDLLDDAGIENYQVEANTDTGDHEFEPEQSYFDGLTEYCNNLGWYVEDTRDGLVVVGSETYVKNVIPATTHTFVRGVDVLTRGFSVDASEIYTRVCVRRKLPTPLYVYGNVPTDQARGIPNQSTYYRDVYEDTTQTDMESLRDQIIENLKYRGRSEIFTTGFRPWLQIGDGCKIEGGVGLNGVITDIYHAVGKNGYYTQIVVSEGGSMSDPTQEPALNSKYVPRLIDRNKAIQSYINDPNKA